MLRVVQSDQSIEFLHPLPKDMSFHLYLAICARKLRLDEVIIKKHARKYMDDVEQILLTKHEFSMRHYQHFKTSLQFCDPDYYEVCKNIVDDVNKSFLAVDVDAYEKWNLLPKVYHKWIEIS